MSVSNKHPIAVREAHYVEHFGSISEPIMHSTDDKIPHIDVYQFPPSGSRDHWVLITGGMSDLRQSVPAEAPDYVSARTELVMYVREPQPWMFRLLKLLADMPFADDTFLHWWHTVPYGMSMIPERSLLTSAFFLPPYFEEEDFDTLEVLGDKIDILWMIPITDSELQYKLDYGGQALEELLSQKELNPVVDERRGSVV